MQNLEDEVRRLLADAAGSAPTGVGLLTAVKARSRHKVILRRTGLAGLVVIAVGASGTTIPILLRGMQGHPQPGGSPSGGQSTSAPSATPTSTEAPPSALRLEPVTTQPTVTFPYTPTFVPAHFPPATVIRTESDFLLHARQADDSLLIRVGVGATQPTLASAPGLEKAKLQPVTVRGHAGKLASKGGRQFLFWQEKPGEWLGIFSVGVTRSDLLQYAEGLQHRTLKNTEAFRYSLLPPGLVIHESLHYNATFSPAGAPPDAEPIAGLVVTLNDSAPHTGTRVKVGTHTGHLSTTDGGRQLVVDLGNHATLTVGFDGLDDADLIRFAAGITVDLSSI